MPEFVVIFSGLSLGALSCFVIRRCELSNNCKLKPSNICYVLCSVEVQEFFCLNDPPGPYDSLEESRVSIGI